MFQTFFYLTINLFVIFFVEIYFRIGKIVLIKMSWYTYQVFYRQNTGNLIYAQNGFSNAKEIERNLKAMYHCNISNTRNIHCFQIPNNKCLLSISILTTPSISTFYILSETNNVLKNYVFFSILNGARSILVL